MMRWPGTVRRSLVSRLAVLAVAAVVGGPAPAAAQEPRRLTAEESVRLGLEHSPRVRAARARADAAAAVSGQRRAALLPHLEARASYTRLSEIESVRFTVPGVDSALTLTPIERNRYQAEVRLEQPLFTGLRLRNEASAAARRAEAASYAAEQEIADVALEIRRAYWELHAARATLEAVEAAVARVERHLEDVRNRLAEGAALRRDLLSAETRLAEVELERVEAENALRVGRLELNRLLGLPLDTPVEPVDTIEAEPPSGDLDELTARALEARPEIRALEREVAAAGAAVAATRGRWLPELSLVGRYVYARPNEYFFTEQDRFRSNWELGVSARLGLFEGGRRRAVTGEASAARAEAGARLAAAREAAVVRVTREYLEVRRAADAVAVSERAVGSAEEAFRVAGLQFAEGAALSADVLDAEEALREARARQARAAADYAVARAALLNAQGRVW